MVDSPFGRTRPEVPGVCQTPTFLPPPTVLDPLTLLLWPPPTTLWSKSFCNKMTWKTKLWKHQAWCGWIACWGGGKDSVFFLANKIELECYQQMSKMDVFADFSRTRICLLYSYIYKLYIYIISYIRALGNKKPQLCRYIFAYIYIYLHTPACTRDAPTKIIHTCHWPGFPPIWQKILIR